VSVGGWSGWAGVLVGAGDAVVSVVADALDDGAAVSVVGAAPVVPVEPAGAIVLAAAAPAPEAELVSAS
jgi:hypothetical protein